MNHEEDNLELPKKIEEVNNSIVTNDIINPEGASEPVAPTNRPADLSSTVQNAFPSEIGPSELTNPEPVVIPNIPDNSQIDIAFQPQNDVVVPSPSLMPNTPADNPASDLPQSIPTQFESVEPIQQPVNVEAPIENDPQNETALSDPVTPVQQPILTEDPTLNQPQPNLVTPQPVIQQSKTDQMIQPDVKLEKKIVVEEPVKKEKEKGNPIVGFFALLIILGAILAAGYYFISEGIIKLPDNIKLPAGIKIPVKETTTQKSPYDDQLTISYGAYKEQEPYNCSNNPISIIINEDKSFLYTQVTIDPANNNCSSADISGTYAFNTNTISLTKGDGEIIEVDVFNENNETIISVPIGDKNIKLYSTA